MANDLTGDFDVVVQFSKHAVERVLAAMHRGNRFPHTLSLRVTDSHKAHGLPGRVLVTVSVVDKFGNPTVNPALLSPPLSSLRLIPPSNPLFSALDALANAPRRVHSEAPGLGDYTGLEGGAQLQLSTPKITIPDQSRLTLHMQMMAHWIAAPDTPLMPEFLRGEIQITVRVDRVASQVGNVIDINLNPKNVEVIYIDAWHSKLAISKIIGAGGSGSGPLSPDQKNKINQVIRNAITTSFQPSNAVLPPSVQSMQFKGLTGGPPAIGVLINVNDGPGDPGSVSDVFLGGGDDFAFAASGDFILGTFNSLVDQLKTLQVNFTSTLADYKVTVSNVRIELLEGQILLTVDGDAVTHSWVAPTFSFTVRQAFTLVLVDAAGNPSGPLRTAQLALVGDIVFDPHRGGLARAIIDAFTDQVVDNLRQIRDKSVAGMQGSVRTMLSADRNLGGFLKSLMNPTNRPAGAPPLEELDPDLEYTSFEIHPSGIVLHGSLAVPPPPGVHAEFAIIPNAYTALHSWIPGGTIHQYTWSLPGQPAHIDPNKFMFVDPPAGSLAGTSVCVKVEGKQFSTSGPVTELDVSAATCRFISFPVAMPRESGLLATGQGLPPVALTRVAASGELEVVGHASPWATADAPVAESANWIVHFPDEKSLAHLDHLATAARQSERADTSVAILAVLAPDQLAKVKPAGGLLFADDPDHAWEHLLEVKRRPATVVIGAAGQVVWRHEGELAIAALADALRTHSVAGGSFRPRLLQLSVRVGQFPPNFVFDYAPGREATLRKLVGRPVVLVFWKSSSKPSLETLRELSNTTGEARGRGPILLAINDGEPLDVAKNAVAKYGLSVIAVPDPEREISLAYGVNLWPTTIFVDALGVVRDMQYGLFSVEQLKHPSPANTTAAQ